MPEFRTIEQDIPAWNKHRKTVIREPSVEAFMRANVCTDRHERTIILLGDMLLDDEGNSVGEEAIRKAPARAYIKLAEFVPQLLDEEAEVTTPLDPGTSSNTG